MTPGEWPTRRTKSSGKIFSDRRLASRYPLEAKATISSLDAVYSAFAVDRTPEGAFLVLDLLDADAIPVELAREVEDGLASIDVTGRVVRVASEAEGAGGFAVEFDGIEAEDAKCIISGTQRS